jgi:hypothetical protein
MILWLSHSLSGIEHASRSVSVYNDFQFPRIIFHFARLNRLYVHQSQHNDTLRISAFKAFSITSHGPWHCFSDKPGKSRDFYHSCYSLSGLSVAQNFNIGPIIDSEGNLTHEYELKSPTVSAIPNHSLMLLSLAFYNVIRNVLQIENTVAKHSEGSREELDLTLHSVIALIDSLVRFSMINAYDFNCYDCFRNDVEFVIGFRSSRKFISPHVSHL